MNGEFLGLDGLVGERWCGCTRLRVFVAGCDLEGCCYDHNDGLGSVVERNQIQTACSGTDFEVLLIARMWC